MNPCIKCKSPIPQLTGCWTGKHENLYYVCCRNCDIWTGEYDKQEDAIARWDKMNPVEVEGKMKIWKYTLRVDDTQTIMMPADPKCLTVQVQNGVPQLWAMIIERNQIAPLTIKMYGTNQPLPINPGEYISSFQIDGGKLVFHVFEVRYENH